MGSSMAPEVANLYMGNFEDKFIYSINNPFHSCIIKWWQYLDDVFLSWRDDQRSLLQFHV